ncbi:MAG: helix-turn-helix domain-containing protein, partial [Chitinophagaceae bacterium]|nr:helix-turn-helix domain-containing protein [Chitinophagaceae bacterium]
HYENEKIHTLFIWKNMVDDAFLLHEKTLNTKLIPAEFEAAAFWSELIEKLKAQEEIAERFKAELDSLFNELSFRQHQPESHAVNEKIELRLQKALVYFLQRIYDELILPLQNFILKFDGVARIRKYVSLLEETENNLWQKITQLQSSTYDNKRLLPEDLIARKAAKESRSKPKKKEKGDSAKESYAYYCAGKSIEEISRIRHLAPSTIETHLAEFVRTGELDVSLFLQPEDIQKIKEIYDDEAYYSSTVIVQKLNNEVTHTQVRMALNHLLFKEEIIMKPFLNLGVK